MVAAPKADWRMEGGRLKAYIDGTPVTWAAQPGSQEAFLRCPIFEALIAGNRGGGKTDTLLMDYAQNVGRGYGDEWRGILFRRTYPELDDVVNKSRHWFKEIWPEDGPNPALFNIQKMAWSWKTGETLLFRHMSKEADYWSYHGHCLRAGDVLTPGGWRPIADIKVGEMVYAVDTNRNLVPMPVATKTDMPYDGDLVVHKGRGTFMEMTPNHGVAKVSDTGTLSHVKYCDLGFEATIGAHVAPLHREDVVTVQIPEAPRNAKYATRYRDQPLEVSGDNFAEFMGWFLSEGCTTPSNFQVGIAQSKVLGRNAIENLLTRMGMVFGKTAAGFVFNSVDWSNFLKDFGKCRDKYIPKIIKDMGYRQLRIFFEAAMAGDGSWQKENAYYFTTSQQLADDVCEIATKLGYKVYVSSRSRAGRKGLAYTVACRGSGRKDITLRTDVRKRDRRSRTKEQVSRHHHKGRVYCLGLKEHHMFVIRQKGCVWISGNSYPWIGWEEITTWPDDGCYKRMFSCCRSSHPAVAKMAGVRGTANPYGAGHSWVKKRFRLPIKPDNAVIGPVIRDSYNKAGDLEPPRVVIRSSLAENKILLLADPGYLQRIKAAARNEAELAAWIHGSWDITCGGMFDDLWLDNDHVIGDIPYDMLRQSRWKLNRAYDHGQAKPFSLGWWAESNGQPLEWNGNIYGPVKGDLILFDEWYGYTGEDNEGLRMPASRIAEGILDREVAMGIKGYVKRGPADRNIWTKMDGPTSPYSQMRSRGIYFDKADMAPGSRSAGWEKIRELLVGTSGSKDENGVVTRTVPGLFVCARNREWLRTVPCLPRDDKKLDDVNTKVEDHCGDQTRYRVRWSKKSITQRSW